MKKLLFLTLLIPSLAFASFSGVTPDIPVLVDDVCYPYQYWYDGSVGRTYIAATTTVDFSGVVDGGSIYEPPVTADGTALFIKDVTYTASDPPTLGDWTDHSVDYMSNDHAIFGSWWIDNGGSAFIACSGETPEATSTDAQGLVGIIFDYQIQFWLGMFLFLLPLWILKRYIFD